MLLAQVLAQAPDPAGSGGGPLGLFVIALLAIVTVLLIRNMSKRLKRLPPSFDHTDEAPPPGDDPPPPSAGSK